MGDLLDESIPQWKRELILRRRAAGNSKQLSVGVRTPDCCSEALGRAGHQPIGIPAPTASSCATLSAATTTGGPRRCDWAQQSTCSSNAHQQRPAAGNMVQERPWSTTDKQISVDMVANGDNKNLDSDSSEEFQYGPGIVSRLKNRYLNLTLREQTVKPRPTILRKAASLENLLDGDDDPHGNGDAGRVFQTRMNGNLKNVPNRYRNANRGSDMKRARSVETISRDHRNSFEPAHNDDVLIIATEGNDKPNRKIEADNILNENESKMFTSNNAYPTRINRPKRIPPVMNEKEKPPADVVKQTKKIFEARPESRTRPPQQTGEVAAKVASYKNIIIQTKVSNKPPIIKQKPAAPVPEKRKAPRPPPTKLPIKPAWSDKESPDITSPTTNGTAKPKIRSPDIAPLSSPIPDVSMINETEPENRKTSNNLLTQTPDLIPHSSPIHATPQSPVSSDGYEDSLTTKPITREHQLNISKASSSVTFDFNNKNISQAKLPPTQPLKLEINGTPTKQVANPSPLLEVTKIKSPTPLSPREIEKNFINQAKSQQQQQEQSVVVIGKVLVDQKKLDEEQKCVVVPKPNHTRRSKQEPQNCVVFKFTDRKDVPDYIGHDGTVRTTKIELPKAGEGGVTLLPGASIKDIVQADEDELLSLEGPPSPCDVDFINGNILIDGRSSLSQKTKKPKMRIQFVEAVPQIFEYPSESSMWVDESSQQVNAAASSVGHTVPLLSGSSLANYTPKASFSAEDFELGVTRTAQTESKPVLQEPLPTDEAEEPVLFSSGTNSDILF